MNHLHTNWLGYEIIDYRHCCKSTSCCLSEEQEDTQLISLEAVNHKSPSPRQRQGSMQVSGKLPTYPSLKLTLTLTVLFTQGKMLGYRRGRWAVSQKPTLIQRQYQLLLDYESDDTGCQSCKVGPMCFQEALDMTLLMVYIFLPFLQANVIRHKSTEFMTFSMSLAGFVVSSLWTIYGHLVQDKFITVSCGLLKFWAIVKKFRVTSALSTFSPSRPKDMC